MASPFNVFRKNQRILMVVLVGLSMIAFIAFDTLNPSNIVPITAALLGAAALWLLSGRNGPEGWAIGAVGAAVGLVIGLVGPGLFRDDTVALIEGGSISRDEMRDLANRRQMAEALAREAVLSQGDLRQMPRQFFSFPDPADPDNYEANLLLGHLFGLEADRLGVTVTDKALGEFLNNLSDGKFTETKFQELRTRLRVGSQQLRDALRQELRAQQAARMLMPSADVSPLALWEDFKRLRTTTQVTAVAVPAEAFVDQVEDPSASELAEFFNRYSLVPSVDGKPGFLTPRKVQVAYLELDLESATKEVPEPTDDEVRQYYERNKDNYRVLSFDPPAGGTPGGPMLTPPASGATESETAPAAERPPVEAPSPSAGAETEKPATPAEPPAGQESSALPASAEFVSFQAEPVGDATAAPASNPEAAAATEAAPAATTPPAAKPEEPKYRPLDDELKATIRETLRRQRAVERLDARTAEVRAELDALVGEKYMSIPLPEDPDDAEAAKAYAARQQAAIREVLEAMKKLGERPGIHYAATPRLSDQELFDSEDHPIGTATRWEPGRTPFDRDFTTVTQTVFSAPPDQLLVPGAAESNLTGSRFVYVKTEDVAPRVPSLEEPGVRDRVVESWKRVKARDLAEARAKAVAEEAKASGKTLSALATEPPVKTVTGKEGGQPLTAREVGPFTWLRTRSAPSTGFAMPEITLNDVPQIENAGEEFMRTVFERLKVGEIGSVSNADGTVFYVVQVKDRTPSTEEGYAPLRDEFVQARFDFLFPRGSELGAQASQAAMEGWIAGLKEKHAVAWTNTPAPPPEGAL